MNIHKSLIPEELILKYNLQDKTKNEYLFSDF